MGAGTGGVDNQGAKTDDDGEYSLYAGADPGGGGSWGLGPSLLGDPQTS